MLLCQHLGWDPWGKKVCRGRRGSARAERVEAQRPHRHHGRDYRADLFANFIVGVVFLSALGSLGGSVTFGIFLALALVSFAFVYVLAPETKGRPLEAIRTYWYNGGRWPEETHM
jgi:hypothetical protein